MALGKISTIVRDTKGRPLGGTPCKVTASGTDNLVAIFESIKGGQRLPNPILSNQTGHLAFWVSGGFTYDITTLSKGGDLLTEITPVVKVLS